MNTKTIPALVALVAFLFATPALANHEGTNDGSEGAALLLSSTSVTTTAVVGGIILTVILATDAGSMENYLDQNAVALQTDLSLGAGATVDDLAMAFHIDDADRSTFGAITRANRKTLLELADPALLTTDRAREFVRVLLVECAEAGIVDVSKFANG